VGLAGAVFADQQAQRLELGGVPLNGARAAADLGGDRLDGRLGRLAGFPGVVALVPSGLDVGGERPFQVPVVA
jgi:hypothetical protein